MQQHKRNRGGLSFRRLLMDYSGLGSEKVAALLCYFQQRLCAEGTADDDRIIR